MAAVLRNNFWLAIHVLIVTASYGAGALAWGLSNVSLALYAFGHYRDADEKQTQGKPARRRPPKACSVLAGYTYRAVQLAVLLLAAGTITGAIWADFAWGRYWGWDPKEVWALVTLLVYMVILHGRWGRLGRRFRHGRGSRLRGRLYHDGLVRRQFLTTRRSAFLRQRCWRAGACCDPSWVQPAVCGVCHIAISRRADERKDVGFRVLAG